MKVNFQIIKRFRISTSRFVNLNGAGEGIRTLDIHLGKVVLYQLSYARKKKNTLFNFDKIQGNNANDNDVIP